MLVADRYDEYTDATEYRFDRSGRSSYYRDSLDERYENERRSTSDAERDRLMSSLERTGTRSRLERIDESRYGHYAANYAPATNNYDRMLDRRAAETAEKSKKIYRRRTPLVVAYLVVALAAIVAVTLSVVGVESKEIVESLEVQEPSVSASAEGVAETGALSAAEPEVIKEGGENYIMLATGELVAVEIPKSTQAAKEEEKGFDKFCSWLNGVFGGE